MSFQVALTFGFKIKTFIKSFTYLITFYRTIFVTVHTHIFLIYLTLAHLSHSLQAINIFLVLQKLRSQYLITIHLHILLKFDIFHWIVNENTKVPLSKLMYGYVNESLYWLYSHTKKCWKVNKSTIMAWTVYKLHCL